MNRFNPVRRAQQCDGDTNDAHAAAARRNGSRLCPGSGAPRDRHRHLPGRGPGPSTPTIPTRTCSPGPHFATLSGRTGSTRSAPPRLLRPHPLQSSKPPSTLATNPPCRGLESQQNAPLHQTQGVTSPRDGLAEGTKLACASDPPPERSRPRLLMLVVRGETSLPSSKHFLKDFTETTTPSSIRQYRMTPGVPSANGKDNLAQSIHILMGRLGFSDNSQRFGR